MPEPIIEVSVKPSADKLRLEWGMVIEDGRWLWGQPHLEVHLYCEPFPPGYGNPELIHTGLDSIQTTHTGQAGLRTSFVPVEWTFGKEKTRSGFFTRRVTSDGEGRYFPLYLHLEDVTPGEGPVEYFPVEWPVDAGWLSKPFKWWVDFGYRPRGKFKRVVRVASPVETLPSGSETKVDPATAPRVFISYQRDSEAIARQVHEHLEQAGFQVWQDVDNVRGTARWSVAIDHALRDTDRIVLLLTPKAMESDEVFNEWFFFYSKRKPIHCLMVETCELHYQLLPFQYLDWREPARRNWAKLVQELTTPFEWPSVSRKEKVVNTGFARMVQKLIYARNPSSK